MESLKRIDIFGVHAVYGRPHLYEREIRQMVTAQNIVNAYRARAQAGSWEAWTKENPIMAKLLFKAQQLHGE